MTDEERIQQADREIDEYVSRHPDDDTVNLALRGNVIAAVNTLGLMLESPMDTVKLAAARDILDRAGYKPVERKDITSGGQPISSQPELSDEKLKDIIDGFLKRTAIDVPATEVRSPEGNLQKRP
jgi:hypothetical protein